MRRRRAGLAWLAAACIVAGAALEATACPRTSPDEVEALVREAAALVERIGLRAALPRLMDPEGRYRKGEFYVFVLDRRGVLWANGAFFGGIGEDISGSRDSKGRYFVREMLRIAERRGHGWVQYEWVDPCTGEFAEKQTFVHRAGDFIVAAGLYRALRV